MVSLLCNPLATADQLASSPSQADGVPADFETSLRWAGSELIQGAGILLRLPQKTVATAIVLFQRFYLISSMRSCAIIDSCHAAIFLSSKLTEHPAKPRDIINVTTYLLNIPSPSPISPAPIAGQESTPPEEYYVTEQEYFIKRTRLLNVEMEILKACGFQTHLSLPYTLCINYIQSLSVLSAVVVKKSFGYLTDSLLSPSLLYLTHQPNSLAVAAVYIGARECEVKLPAGWWDMFDCEREELGFLVVCMKGVKEFVESERKLWRGRKPGVPWELDDLENHLERRRVLDSELEV
ncbi:cyclin-like protein [Tuber brumale]|nr:cyclin-like protein [Tuber brumale]